MLTSTFTFNGRRSSSRNVVVPRILQLHVVSSLLLILLTSSLSSLVQAANIENSTTVTLKNSKIIAPGVQQVQGKILYDAGYVDLSSLIFSVNPEDGSNSESAAASASGESSTEFFYMDLAMLHVPEICPDGDTSDTGETTTSGTTTTTTSHCDWAEAWTLGVSIPSNETNSMGEPELWWCCTKDAMESGACTSEQYGRLLINETIFHGQRASLQIPSSGIMIDMESGQSIPFAAPLPDIALGFGFNQAGMYTLILANCNENAQDIYVNGDTIWASFNEMEIAHEAIPFYIILGIGYAILLTWFWYLLQANKGSRIKLEEWIFATIALGFFEMLFQTIEFFFWGGNGSRLPILSLIAMIVSAAKHSFGRCLLLMVAMGWGVVRATLARHTFMGIVAMGTLYLTASAMFDIYFTVEWENETKNSDNSYGVEGNGTGEPEETGMSDFIQVCFWLSFYIDIVFMIWIPSAMGQTMHYLKTTNQLRKLERYQVLLKIMMVAIVLTVLTIILVFSRAFGLSFMDISEGNEINFFIILTFVAVVWRPNPNAREFAYAMELGTGDDDNDDGTTDLELVADSACDFQQQQQQSKRSNNGTYEGGGAPTIDRAEPA